MTFDLESGVRVTCDLATSVPISVLGLSALDLHPMQVTDRQTSDAHHRLMPRPMGQTLLGTVTHTGVGHNKNV